MTPAEIQELAQEVAKIVLAELKNSSQATELDSIEVAALLKVSKPTVERWTKDGTIPSYLVGRCRRYNRDAVLQTARKSERLSKIISKLD